MTALWGILLCAALIALVIFGSLWCDLRRGRDRQHLAELSLLVFSGAMAAIGFLCAWQIGEMGQ